MNVSFNIDLFHLPIELVAVLGIVSLAYSILAVKSIFRFYLSIILPIIFISGYYALYFWFVWTAGVK